MNNSSMNGFDTLLAAVAFVENPKERATSSTDSDAILDHCHEGPCYGEPCNTMQSMPRENNPGVGAAAVSQGLPTMTQNDGEIANMLPNDSKSFMQQLEFPPNENASVADGKPSDEVKTFAINEEKKDFVTMQVPNATVNYHLPTTTIPGPTGVPPPPPSWNVMIRHPIIPGGFDLQQQKEQQQRHQLQNALRFYENLNQDQKLSDSERRMPSDSSMASVAAVDQYQFNSDPNTIASSLYKPNTIQTLNNNRIAAAAGSGEKVNVFECQAPPPKASYAGEQNHVFAAANNAAASSSLVPIHTSHPGQASGSQMDQHQIHNNWGEHRVVLTQYGDTSVVQQQPGVSGAGAAKNELHQYHQNPGAAIQQRMGEQQRPQPNRAGASGNGRSQSLTHNQLEKNRRAHLKGCFEKLRETIPRLGTRRASNLTILKSANRHIETMNKRTEEYEKDRQTAVDKKILQTEYYERLYNGLVEQYGKCAVDKYQDEGLQRRAEALRQESLRAAPAAASIMIDDTGTETSTASEGEDEDMQQRSTTNKFAFLPPGRHVNASRYQPVPRPTSVRPESPATHLGPISGYRPVVLSTSQMMPMYVQKPVTMATQTTTAAVGSNYYHQPQQPQQQVITTSYMVQQSPQPIVTAPIMTNGGQVQGSQGQMVRIIHPQQQQTTHATTTMAVASPAVGAGGGIIRPLLPAPSAVGQPQQQLLYLTMPSNYPGVQHHPHPLIPIQQQQQQQQVKPSSDGKPPQQQQQQVLHRVQAPQGRNMQRIHYTQASGRSFTPSPPTNISHPIQLCRGGSPMQSEHASFENNAASPLPPAMKEMKKPDIISGKLTPPLLVNQPVSLAQQQLAVEMFNSRQQSQEKERSKEQAAQAQAATQPPTQAAANPSPRLPRVVSLPKYAGYDVKVKYVRNASIPVSVQYPLPIASTDTTTVQAPLIPAQAPVISATPTAVTYAPKTATTSAQPSTSSSPSKPRPSRSTHQMTSLYVAASADNLGNHSDADSDDCESGFQSATKRFSGNDVKNSDTSAATVAHWRKNLLAVEQQKNNNNKVGPSAAAAVAATTNNSRHISALKFHNTVLPYHATTTAPITTMITTNGGEAKDSTTSPTSDTSDEAATSSTASPLTISSVEGGNSVLSTVTSQTLLSVTMAPDRPTSSADNTAATVIAVPASHDQSAVKVNDYALQVYSSSTPSTTGQETSQAPTQAVVQNAPQPAANQLMTVAPAVQRQNSVSAATTTTSMPQMMIQMQRPMMTGAPQNMHHHQIQQVPTTIHNGQVTYQLMQASAMPPQMFTTQPQMNYVTMANNNNNNEASADNKNQQQQQQQPTLVALPNGMNGMMSFQQVLPLNVIMYQGSPSTGPNGQHMGQPIMVRTTQQQQQQPRKRPNDDDQDEAARKRSKSTTTQQATQVMGQHVVLPAQGAQGGSMMMAMGPHQGNGAYNIVGYPMQMPGTGAQAMHVGFPPGAQLAVAPSPFMQQQQ